jgi:hypothetical protein
MTEAEWLAAADPEPMLEFLRGRGGTSERKLRLFAVSSPWHGKIKLTAYPLTPPGPRRRTGRM